MIITPFHARVNLSYEWLKREYKFNKDDLNKLKAAQAGYEKIEALMPAGHPVDIAKKLHAETLREFANNPQSPAPSTDKEELTRVLSEQKRAVKTALRRYVATTIYPVGGPIARKLAAFTLDTAEQVERAERDVADRFNAPYEPSKSVSGLLEHAERWNDLAVRCERGTGNTETASYGDSARHMLSDALKWE